MITCRDMKKRDSTIFWSAAENIIRSKRFLNCWWNFSTGLIAMHDMSKYATADLFPLTRSGRDGFDHDFHRRGRRRQLLLHLLHQRGARSGAGGAGHQARQQDPGLPQTAVFQSVQDQEPGGGGPRLPWPGSHWDLLLRVHPGLFASRNGHDDQQLRAKWVWTLKLFPRRLITLPRLFTSNVTFVFKITHCTCVPQQISSQLVSLWRPAWETQWTSAWSWSTPSGGMWPGSTTVSQQINYQEILNKSRLESLAQWKLNNTLVFFFFFRKLLLHDSLDRHGQRHRCSDVGGREDVPPRHLQCQLCGGQPPQRSLDEAHRQRFAGSRHSNKNEKQQNVFFCKAGLNMGDLLNCFLFPNREHIKARTVAYLQRLR